MLYFRSRGFEPLVIPGVSSALDAPTFAGIPVTQRGVAESFIVCTGVGRKGKEVQLPPYERARTLVVLMGVARLSQVVAALIDTSGANTRREGPAYPLHTPIAIIERASMPDQRVIFSTLKDIVKALDSNGEQRPPGNDDRWLGCLGSRRTRRHGSVRRQRRKAGRKPRAEVVGKWFFGMDGTGGS